MKTAEKYEVCRTVLSARLDLGGIIIRKEKRLRDAVKAVREGRFSQIQAARYYNVIQESISYRLRGSI
jgi:hypothetical protein